MGKRGPMPKNRLPVSTKKPVPVTIVSSPPSTSKASLDDDRKWRAQDALRAIQRAEECKRDKQLMSDVKKLAQEQMAGLKSITK